MPHITRINLQARSGLDSIEFGELWVTVRTALLCPENRIGLAGPTLGGSRFEEWVTASLGSWAGEMYWGAEAGGAAEKKLVWGNGGEDGDHQEIRKVFRDLVIYIAGNARYTNKVRATSLAARTREYSPAVNALGSGSNMIESNGACVPAQPGKRIGLEFSIPYMPPPNEFPRFQRETAPLAPIQRNKHRYPTRRRSAPFHIKLSEVIPKPAPRRRRKGNWTVHKKKVTRTSEPAATPPNPAPLPLVPLSRSQPLTPLPPTRAPPVTSPAPPLVKHSEAPSPERKLPKANSSHQVFVTRLAEKTPMEPSPTLVKLIYVSDVQTLDSFLKKLCQKWGLPEVKGVRVEVGGQVFEVDLEEERDWEVVLGVVGSMAGVVVCG